MNYTALEDRLFEEWKTRSRQCGDGEEIAPDGLLYRGLFSYADGYWTRRPGDECRRWEQAPRRVLILTKDLNDTEAWDIRCETGRRNFSGPADATVSAPFYKNLMRWVYGLLTADRHGNTRPFDEADRPDTFRPFYDEAPVARINCKKQPGGSQLTNSALQAFLTRYADLLERQIRLYDADILLCCGGSDLIKDFVQAHYLPDLCRMSDWMWYSPSVRKLVVNSWHPSYHGDTHEGMYTAMMQHYSEFLHAFPGFFPGR